MILYLLLVRSDDEGRSIISGTELRADEKVVFRKTLIQMGNYELNQFITVLCSIPNQFTNAKIIVPLVLFRTVKNHNGKYCHIARCLMTVKN